MKNLPKWAVTRVFNWYRCKARQRGITWGLTVEQVKEIIHQKCYWCGYKRVNRVMTRKPRKSRVYRYSGIDRVNNKKSYTIDNVLPCCKVCNRAKGDLTLQQWHDYRTRIALFIQGQK